jgi:NUMOD4 motif.
VGVGALGLLPPLGSGLLERVSLYQEEVWVEIEGFPNYAVSNRGRVVNLDTDMILSERTHEKGYLRVALYKGGARQDIYIHQLVAAAFFARFRRGEHVEHVNGDPTDNRPENLRNRKQRIAIVREAEESRRLRMATDEAFRAWGKPVKVIETGQVFRTVRDCADFIGGDYSSIYRCLRNERGKHMGYTFEYEAS